MLETMIDNPFPTRAEVSDVFNAVRQKADAIMLSGETSIGKYPIKTVEVMKRVALQAEATTKYKHNDYEGIVTNSHDHDKKALIRSAVRIAEEMNMKGMVIFTKSGRLARMASAFRPKVAIYAYTNRYDTQTRTTTLFGVIARYFPFDHHTDVLNHTLHHLVDSGEFNPDDKVVVVSDILRDGKEIPVLQIVTINEHI
jgi:pyruvate kinase